MYYLEMSVRGGNVQVLVNELKLERVQGGSGGTLAKPINTHLVGEKNELKIRALPAQLESGKISKVSDLHIVGTVKRYESGDVVSPEGGDVLERFDFDEVIAKREQAFAEEFNPTNIEGQVSIPEVTFPIEHTITFDNEGVSFQKLLMGGAVIEDEDQLLSYAERLRSLMKERNAEALYQEFKPKFDDYRAAYPEISGDFAVVFPNFLREQFFPEGPITEFDQSDIELRSWCEGRIWELYRKPKEPFFATKGLEGSILELPVFVGKIDGELKVVR